MADDVRAQRELARGSHPRARAETDAERFESYLAALVTLHADAIAACDWPALASAPAPVEPAPGTRHTAAAQALYASYRPRLLERISGRARLERIALKNRLAAGRHRDRVEYEQARYRHERAHDAWQAQRALAGRILAGDTAAFGDALRHAGAFAALAALQTSIAVTAIEPDGLVLDGRIRDDEIVPLDEPTAGDTPRPLDRDRYWALYRSHVCSAALRAARDAFAALPVGHVVVNIGPVPIDPASGCREPVTWLAARVVRATLAALPLDQLAACEAMTSIPHRMAFDAATGLAPVEPIGSAEQSGPVPRAPAPALPLYR
jgi:hypothetical protein